MPGIFTICLVKVKNKLHNTTRKMLVSTLLVQCQKFEFKNVKIFNTFRKFDSAVFFCHLVFLRVCIDRRFECKTKYRSKTVNVPNQQFLAKEKNRRS